MSKKLKKLLPRKVRHSKVWEKPTKESQARLAFDQELVWQQRKQKRIPTWRQFKYISSFFSARERFAVTSAILMIFIAIIMGSSMTYSLFVEAVPKQGGTYQEALIGYPLYLNPILANTNDIDLDISSLIYSGLLKYDKNLELQTDLAESWEVNEDGTVYKATLKDDLVWHDGHPLTIDDVLFTFRAIQEPAVNSPLQLSMQGVQVTQIDDKTVQFELDSAFQPFESLLTVGLLPRHLWANLPSSNIRLAELNIKPIGAGPWQFKKLEKDKLGNIYSYTVEPFEEHPGERAYLNELTFRFYPDFNTAIEALNNKKVEGLSFIPRQLIEQVTSAQNLSTNHLQLPQTTAVFFNQDNNEALQDVNVRKALAQSIDQERLLNEAIDGLGISIDGPLLPGMPGYDESYNPFAYQPVESQSILDEAGWEIITAQEYIEQETTRIQEEREDSGIDSTDPIIVDTGNQATFRQKDGNILSIRLTTVDQPENVRAAEILRNSWQSIGFKVDLEVVPVSILTSTLLPNRDYESLLYGQILNIIPDFYTFWHSSQVESPGLNLANFADGDADELVESMRTTTDPTEQIELYQSFQKLLEDELPALFLYSPQYTYLLPKSIQGYDVHQISIPADRWNNINEWYTETKNQWK